jgi:hypothetical protein
MMEYNSERPAITLPEYGRNIQKMVQFSLTVTDRDERNKVAQGIINVMGMLKPHLRDVEEFKPKLWAHLFLMSEFKLDVDCPFPTPKAEHFQEKPRIVPYPQHNIRFKHYGRTVQLLIGKAVEMEDNEERDALTLSIANLMKRSYLNWNRDSVTDEVILNNLSQLSDGVLIVKDTSRIVATGDVVKTQSGSGQNTGSSRKTYKKSSNSNNKGKKNNYKKKR